MVRPMGSSTLGSWNQVLSSDVASAPFGDLVLLGWAECSNLPLPGNSTILDLGQVVPSGVGSPRIHISQRLGAAANKWFSNHP